MTISSEDRLFSDEDSGDVISAVLSLVEQAYLDGKELAGSTLLEIDRDVRFRYQGSTYCQKKTPRETLAKRVRADKARGASMRAISITYNISESTVRRYLSDAT